MLPRKSFSIILCIAYLSMGLMSCGYDTILESNPKNDTSQLHDNKPIEEAEISSNESGKSLMYSDLVLELALQNDADVLELIAIRDEILSRALQRRLSGVEIARAVSNNDIEYFAEILGYTEEQIVILSDRMAVLGGRIVKKYPELLHLTRSEGHACFECRFKDIADGWDDLMAEETGNVALGDESDPLAIAISDKPEKRVTCQWVRYTAALIICAAFGTTPLYFACAIIALCEFCTGGYVSKICQG